MNATIENKTGKIIYSDNALQQLIGNMVTESYGIVGMSNKGESIVELFKKDTAGKGVKVSVQNNKLVVDLFVVVKYGMSLKTVADNIIENVKFTLEDLSGLEVESVNVIIQNIRV